MRVIAKSMLRTFWESSPKYRDAKKQMTEWYNYCSNAQWNSPHELKADLRNASILKNNRVVFNVCGNKYRIVVLTDYSRHGMLIRFAGTHKQHDEIEEDEAREIRRDGDIANVCEAMPDDAPDDAPARA